MCGVDVTRLTFVPLLMEETAYDNNMCASTVLNQCKPMLMRSGARMEKRDCYYFDKNTTVPVARDGSQHVAKFVHHMHARMKIARDGHCECTFVKENARSARQGPVDNSAARTVIMQADFRRCSFDNMLYRLGNAIMLPFNAILWLHCFHATTIWRHCKVYLAD